MYLYIYIYIYVCVCGTERGKAGGLRIASLYKKFFCFEAVIHESIIFVLPSPTCIAHNSVVLLHDYCAIYDPPRPPLAYTIHHTILAMTISCKGQIAIPRDRQRPKRRVRPPCAAAAAV